MNLLEGKVCLVTGAGRGIGATTVRRFAEEGAVVYANVRQSSSYEALIEGIPEPIRGNVRPALFDVTDERAAKRAVMSIKKEAGGLDVLVNNAGVMKDALIGMISHSLMESVFETNVFAAMSMLQLASKVMARQRRGSIINLCSIVGIEGSSGMLVYSASKGAVAAMTKAAAKELTPNGIRVNAVAPGMIDTDMFRSIGEDKMQAHLDNIRMNRFGTPDEVADAIVFLASDLSRYITGEIIGVNGGATV